MRLMLTAVIVLIEFLISGNCTGTMLQMNQRWDFNCAREHYLHKHATGRTFTSSGIREITEPIKFSLIFLLDATQPNGKL